MTIVPRK